MLLPPIMLLILLQALLFPVTQATPMMMSMMKVHSSPTGNGARVLSRLSSYYSQQRTPISDSPDSPLAFEHHYDPIEHEYAAELNSQHENYVIQEGIACFYLQSGLDDIEACLRTFLSAYPSGRLGSYERTTLAFLASRSGNRRIQSLVQSHLDLKQKVISVVRPYLGIHGPANCTPKTSSSTSSALLDSSSAPAKRLDSSGSDRNDAVTIAATDVLENQERYRQKLRNHEKFVTWLTSPEVSGSLDLQEVERHFMSAEGWKYKLDFAFLTPAQRLLIVIKSGLPLLSHLFQIGFHLYVAEEDRNKYDPLSELIHYYCARRHVRRTLSDLDRAGENIHDSVANMYLSEDDLDKVELVYLYGGAAFVESNLIVLSGRYPILRSRLLALGAKDMDTQALRQAIVENNLDLVAELFNYPECYNVHSTSLKSAVASALASPTTSTNMRKLLAEGFLARIHETHSSQNHQSQPPPAVDLETSELNRHAGCSERSVLAYVTAAPASTCETEIHSSHRQRGCLSLRSCFGKN